MVRFLAAGRRESYKGSVGPLLCYISGHGFGHAVRVVEVVRAVWTRRPRLAVAVRTSLPRWFLEAGLQRPFSYGISRLDIGAVQADSLSLDPGATLRAYAEIDARKEALIAAEVAAIAAQRPACILADIPALAFDVAGRLGIPGVALTNFSWDWIYADYARDFPGYGGLVESLRASYGRATLLMRLPLHGDLSAFPRIRDVPLVARAAKLDRQTVCRRLGLPAGERLVLLSFGGIGITLRTPPAVPAGITFVLTQGADDGATPPPPCRVLSNAALRAANVGHEDLVAACDAVMTKPGYGIVAECIANAAPIIYTPRGRFAEYACLVAGIEAHLPHAFISNEDLFAGRWTPALEAVLAQPRRRPQIAANGAAVAAEVLLDYLAERAAAPRARRRRERRLPCGRMETLTIYHNPRCSKSRAALAILQAHEVPLRIVEYLKQPPTRAELEALRRKLGRPAAEWIRKSEAEYKRAGLSANSPEERLLDAMAEHPILIERPIVMRGKRAVVGRPPERVMELLERN